MPCFQKRWHSGGQTRWNSLRFSFHVISKFMKRRRLAKIPNWSPGFWLQYDFLRSANLSWCDASHPCFCFCPRFAHLGDSDRRCLFVFGHFSCFSFPYFSHFTGPKEKCHSPRAPVIGSAGVHVVLHSQSHCTKASPETEGQSRLKQHTVKDINHTTVSAIWSEGQLCNRVFYWILYNPFLSSRSRMFKRLFFSVLRNLNVAIKITSHYLSSETQHKEMFESTNQSLSRNQEIQTVQTHSLDFCNLQ